MNSITTTYPGFQSLPKGVKQMLVVSESLFFEQARGSPNYRTGRPPPEVIQGLKTSPLQEVFAGAGRPADCQLT
jgi:hypothetical protein